jgi:serine/threonine protein kinase
LHGHQLIHRDLKPSNIIFVEGKPKLADIGLVTHIGDGQTFVGTEGYYPPEGPGSPAGDLYSLGKVLYETFTGLNRRQFPDLPPDLAGGEDRKRFKMFNKILLRACQANVEKRYASASQMHTDLMSLTRKRSSLLSVFQRSKTSQSGS